MIINVSPSLPPTENSIVFSVLEVTFGIVVVESLLTVLVTFDTVSEPLVGTICVVTKFLPVVTVTVFTKVSVVGEG